MTKSVCVGVYQGDELLGWASFLDPEILPGTNTQEPEQNLGLAELSALDGQTIEMCDHIGLPLLTGRAEVVGDRVFFRR